MEGDLSRVDECLLSTLSVFFKYTMEDREKERSNSEFHMCWLERKRSDTSCCKSEYRIVPRTYKYIYNAANYRAGIRFCVLSPVASFASLFFVLLLHFVSVTFSDGRMKGRIRRNVRSVEVFKGCYTL